MNVLERVRVRVHRYEQPSTEPGSLYGDLDLAMGQAAGEGLDDEGIQKTVGYWAHDK